MDKKQVMEGLDACRVGSNDLRLPEMGDLADRVQNDPRVRNLYDRVQHLDAGISAAIESVPIPAGLQQRLLERLGAAGAAPSDDRIVVRAAWSRRQWFSAASAAAASVLLAAGLAWFFRPAELGVYEIVELAEQRYENISDNWRTVKDFVEFPLPDALTDKPSQWQGVQKIGGRKAVVYDLSRGKRIRAALLVVSQTLAALPSRPPDPPQSTTGGRTIGAWNSGNFSYVLVVEGDLRLYRSFLTSSAPPVLAYAPPLPRPGDAPLQRRAM